jgi:filamentous hemagglutinin
MDEITLEYVQKYIRENRFDLLPTQDKISFPMIVRYYGMLKNGEIPPAINIENDVIVDGHHRYISGHIYGSVPEKCTWIRPIANEIKSWDAVVVHAEDFRPN